MLDVYMMRFLLLKPVMLHLLALVILLTTRLASVTSQNPPVPKPSCDDRCGDISIPYPFGTTPDCYYNTSFLVNCDRTSFNPPKLFLQNSTIEIKSISLLGQMRVLQLVSSSCYSAGGNVSSNRPFIRVGIFTVNNTANKFTVVGCDAFGYVSGFMRGQQEESVKYRTGCIASCSRVTDVEEGSCSGTGCCQNTIPKNVYRMDIAVGSFNNYTEVKETGNCTFGFFVEDSAFKFSAENLTNLRNVKSLPSVVDWAVGDGNCEEAQKNTSAYACKSENSDCNEPDNGSGYRCYCKDGYHGNPYLSGGCQDIDECNPGPGQNHPCKYDCKNTKGNFTCICPKGQHGEGKTTGEGCIPDKSQTTTVVAGVAIGVIVLLLLACLAYFERNRRQLKKAKRKWFLQNGGELLLEKLPAREGSHDTLKIFSSSELKKATNDFHKDNIVGQGGFGTVYRGVLSDRRTVAIKKSKIVDPNQIEQFVSEVIVVSQINHRNVVKLLGCCLDTEVPHLVYEFIENGTLYGHLHNPIRAQLLNWEKRLRIAAETANVLSYLHSAASIPIIHRDVKSDNILLDHTFTAKVSDFGASRLIPLDQTQISTVVQGTTGYLDPEYLQTHQLTAKSDVYSFGVVLLELITGRMVVKFDGPEKERSLVNYFLYMMKQNSVSLLIDRSIVSDGNRDDIMEVGRIAQWCIRMNGEERPDMRVVAMELQGLLLGRKQQRGETEEMSIEMQPLLGEGVDGVITNGIGSRMSSAGFDSFVDQVAHPISGGR